jgi:hypothetical protein
LSYQVEQTGLTAGFLVIENEPFTEKDEFEESFDVVVREGGHRYTGRRV